jgi:hypothetical protein
MRSGFLLCLGVVVAVLTAGCGGSGLYRTRGRILRDGTPLHTEADDTVRVTLVPIPEGGARVTDVYIANFDPKDSSFRVSGKDGKGMPPGKYRVAVEHLRQRRDLLKGAFDLDRSPYVRDVRSAGDEITIDLAKPN